MIFVFGFFLIGIAVLLAIPALPADGSSKWLRFLVAMLASFAGIMVPLAFFFIDSWLGMPSWKGACQCGWIDGFHTGKLALTPLVLFATAALYHLEISRSPGGATSQWCRIGIYCGAITSIACLAFGFACTRGSEVLLVPLCYLPVWYCWRSIQVSPGLPSMEHLWATLSMLPFWAIGSYWSRSVFEALPDTSPKDCFVVTAASRGHRRLVGPFTVIERNGRSLHANAQLIVFWHFEAAWRARFPRSHRLFRKAYNRLGPHIAARIASPWIADAVFFALKPIEWIATRRTNYHRD